MAFHNIRLPADVEKGAQGGPIFATNILETSSGVEKRNIGWSRTKSKWDVGYGVDSKENLEDIIAFFYARQGRANGFRFKDWSDYLIGVDSTDTPSEIGVGDGSSTAFYAERRYVSGDTYYARTITRLVSGTVRVFAGGIEQSTPADYSVDINTGIVTFAAAPSTGTSIGMIAEFDIPVRFATDKIDISTLRDDAITIPDISLIEIREQPGATTGSSSANYGGIKSSSSAYTLERLEIQQYIMSAEDTVPRGIWVNNSASLILIGGDAGNHVFELIPTVAGDLQSGITVGYSLDISSKETNIAGVFVGNAGSDMYICGASSSIHQYALSTPYDISTASFTRSEDVSAQESVPYGVTLSTDGTKLYFGGPSTDMVYEYTLSTPWDISTMSHSHTFNPAAQTTNVRGVDLNPEGTALLIVDAEVVYQYNLLTPGDLSTAVYSGYSLNYDWTSNAQNVRYAPRGNYVYLVTNDDDSILRYPL